MSFCKEVDNAYSVVVHWRPNLFKVPISKVGQDFVNELAKLFLAFGESSALQFVALKCAMILPPLLLQRAHRRPKDDTTALHRRLNLWLQGNIDTLLHEGSSIQDRLKFSHPKNRSTQSISHSLCSKGKSKMHLDCCQMKRAKVVYFPGFKSR